MNSKSGSGSGLFFDGNDRGRVFLYFVCQYLYSCVCPFQPYESAGKEYQSERSAVRKYCGMLEIQQRRGGAYRHERTKAGAGSVSVLLGSELGVRHRCFRGFFYCRAVCDRDRRTGKWKNMKLMIPCPYGRGMNDRRGSYEYCRDAE